MLGFVLFELFDCLLYFSQLSLVLLALALELGHKLLVLRLQLFNSVLYALDVQFKLLLDPDMLSDVSLQILDQLLVELGARRHGIRRVHR